MYIFMPGTLGVQLMLLQHPTWEYKIFVGFTFSSASIDSLIVFMHTKWNTWWAPTALTPSRESRVARNFRHGIYQESVNQLGKFGSHWWMISTTHPRKGNGCHSSKSQLTELARGGLHLQSMVKFRALKLGWIFQADLCIMSWRSTPDQSKCHSHKRCP